MSKINIEHIAFFAVALSKNISSEILHPHFQKNFSVFQRALKKAGKLKLEVPRRAQKIEVEALASKLNAVLGSPKGWKKVHWMILAYLLVFTNQIERIKIRSEKMHERWIHIEVHVLAIRFAKNMNTETDPVILSFIKQKEIHLISDAFDVITQGEEFSETISSRNIAPHGIRETLRCLLEYEERSQGVLTPVPEITGLTLKQSSKEWNQDLDPEAAQIRVRGIIHEHILRKLLRASSEVALAKDPVRIPVKRFKTKRQKNTYLDPFQFEVGFSIFGIVLCIALLCYIPKAFFSLGIAWWYFSLGLSFLIFFHIISEIIRGNKDSLEIDIQDSFVFGGIFTFLLWFVQKDTFHFGIAWWHAILGASSGGALVLLILPITKAILTKEKIVFRIS